MKSDKMLYIVFADIESLRGLPKKVLCFLKKTCYKYNWFWKKMLPLTKKELKSQQAPKVCMLHLWKKIYEKSC